MTASLSPFLPLPGDVHTPAHLGPEVSAVANLQERLHALPPIPGYRSRFGLIDIDCFRLLALQLAGSDLQGFDVAVLLFLLGHFNHKRHSVPICISEAANLLDRQASQVRRSVRKLEGLGWLYSDSCHHLWFNPLCLRSANRKHQAIAFRHVPDPWSDKAPYHHAS